MLFLVQVVDVAISAVIKISAEFAESEIIDAPMVTAAVLQSVRVFIVSKPFWIDFRSHVPAESNDDLLRTNCDNLFFQCPKHS